MIMKKDLITDGIAGQKCFIDRIVNVIVFRLYFILLSQHLIVCRIDKCILLDTVFKVRLGFSKFIQN